MSNEVKTLARIVEDHKSLDQLLLEIGGELSDEDQERIVDGWMSEIKSNLQTKADGYEYRYRMLEKANEALKERADMIYAAAKSCDTLMKNLKERFKHSMLELGLDEVNGQDFKFKISKGKPTVQVESINLLPAEYTTEKIVIDVDKNKIKEAIDAGKEVPGASLNVSYTLRVSANKKIKELK